MFTPEFWKGLYAVDTDKVTNQRDGYSQHLAEKGSRLCHYLVRDRYGVESPRAPYEGVAKLDGYVSVSAYFGNREEIMTPEEFVDCVSVKS